MATWGNGIFQMGTPMTPQQYAAANPNWNPYAAAQNGQAYNLDAWGNRMITSSPTGTPWGNQGAEYAQARKDYEQMRLNPYQPQGGWQFGQGAQFPQQQVNSSWLAAQGRANPALNANWLAAQGGGTYRPQQTYAPQYYRPPQPYQQQNPWANWGQQLRQTQPYSYPSTMSRYGSNTGIGYGNTGGSNPYGWGMGGINPQQQSWPSPYSSPSTESMYGDFNPGSKLGSVGKGWELPNPNQPGGPYGGINPQYYRPPQPYQQNPWASWGQQFRQTQPYSYPSTMDRSGGNSGVFSTLPSAW